jgi:type III secretion protein W
MGIMSDDIHSQRIQQISSDLSRAQKTQEAQRLAQYALAAEAAEDFTDWCDTAWNPLVFAKAFQDLARRVREKSRQEEASKADSQEEDFAIEKIQEIADDYQEKNPELFARTLMVLRSRLRAQDSLEEILRKVRETYTDLSLADEALDFLLETADRANREKIEQAKAELHRLYDREIKAGRNINAQAREFSAQGLGSPTALRDLYRGVIGNPRDANTLFNELTTAFSYEKMKAVIDFMLHSLGADMKAKGPSIARAELQRLTSETRNMQAILGVFRFFKSRMTLVMSSFERQGLVLPERITFELLGKLLVRFLQERYPSVDKALQLSQQMGISGETLAQIIIYLQLRDAMRQVSPRLFKDERQRQEMLLCFMETLEELDEELEEEEEEKQKKEKK